MAYKDKERQKQANREASRRRRLRQQGMTQDSDKVIPVRPIEPVSVIPEPPANVIPGPIAGYGQAGCQCMHCKQARVNRSTVTLNHGSWKPAVQLAKGKLYRVTLPGDADYTGVADSSLGSPQGAR